MNQDVKSVTDFLLTMVLTPFSWIYGGVTSLRNKLYDKNILPSYKFDVPVVCVGNISVGGTGKTPHVEYLIEKLSPYYKIGVISRGYKRKTKGYVAAGRLSTPATIGDEPAQIHQKYGYRVNVVVCEDRKSGISRMLDEHPDINLVLMDDGFQHRSVHPKVSILLLDSNRLPDNDKLLPLGRLREGSHAMNRAEIVIATKCKDRMQPIDYRIMQNNLKLFPCQQLYFSRYKYTALAPVFPDDCPYTVSLETLTSKDSVLLLTGIASPRSLVKYLDTFDCRLRVAHFPDHHNFSRSNLHSIETTFKKMKGRKKIILTTEKDAVRLSANPYFPQHLKPYIFYQPISVEIDSGNENKDFITELRAMIDKPDA